MVVFGLSPAFPHRFLPFPVPPAALAASPCLLEPLGIDSPPTPSLWEAFYAENGRGRSRDDDVAVDETRPGVFRDFSLIVELVSLTSFGQKRELETTIFQS